MVVSKIDLLPYLDFDIDLFGGEPGHREPTPPGRFDVSFENQVGLSGLAWLVTARSAADAAADRPPRRLRIELVGDSP